MSLFSESETMTMRTLTWICSMAVIMVAAGICEAADEPPTVRVTGVGKA